MANRRMFARDIVQSDAFLDLSLEAQLLYFHVGMVADDEGIVASLRRTALGAGVAPETIEELCDAGFVIRLSSGRYVVTHWLRNNEIKSDRKQASLYEEELKELVCGDDKIYKRRNAVSPESIHFVSKLEPESLQSVSKPEPESLQSVSEEYYNYSTSFEGNRTQERGGGEGETPVSPKTAEDVMAFIEKLLSLEGLDDAQKPLRRKELLSSVANYETDTEKISVLKNDWFSRQGGR